MIFLKVANWAHSSYPWLFGLYINGAWIFLTHLFSAIFKAHDKQVARRYLQNLRDVRSPHLLNQNILKRILQYSIFGKVSKVGFWRTAYEWKAKPHFVLVSTNGTTLELLYKLHMKTLSTSSSFHSLRNFTTWISCSARLGKKKKSQVVLNLVPQHSLKDDAISQSGDFKKPPHYQ